MERKQIMEPTSQENDGANQKSCSALDDINLELTSSEIQEGQRPGDVYVRHARPYQHLFRRVGPGHFVALPETDRPASPVEKGYRAVKRVLIGRPLETAEEIHQRLTKVKALAVFGSDAISSSAYATACSNVMA